MANPHPTPSQISILFILSYLICIISGQPVSLDLGNRLRNDSNAIKLASNDYGNIFHEIPAGVLYPSSISDIMELIKSSYNCSIPFTIAARGNGHSVRGQAMARGGVVVDMSALSKNGSGIRVSGDSSSGFYADVGGEEMWIDVLRATMEKGFSPVSWTDYLYLTVGGTLSNAGISGQAFLHGPQINNVLELDVITGKGEFMTCSRDKNSELFFAILGGLGQFGIITRARIVLDKAPTRVKWVRLLYSDFSMFSRDQERLISGNAPNFVEGFIVTNENVTNEWRSFFSSPSNQSDIVSLFKKQGLLYAIELVKYYDNRTVKTIDKEFQTLLKELNFIPRFIFSTDVPIMDFLGRVSNSDSPDGQLDAHPWLNLFIPKSRITDFNAGVLAEMLPRLNETSSLFIFYPLNKNKWDDRMSAVTPDEDIFYTLALLHSSPSNGSQIIDNFNNQILRFCEKAGIKVRQYLPYYKSKAHWTKHYGSKWNRIQHRKSLFDPKFILSPGQRIFNSA
ncbi:hypothetical protein BUALT_Bualt09G0033400 [Buddleja alternifolia]|uniref:cytokinin dehydrogenase n=1 Tax=Buddleja alternifolia TaxID=168488 RepID=A0AAV6WYV8_9LAMI|nr:hypothetical protein BUALT_Bualt09G0033400 [Buddleja alternifolia]